MGGADDATGSDTAEQQKFERKPEDIEPVAYHSLHHKPFISGDNGNNPWSRPDPTQALKTAEATPTPALKPTPKPRAAKRKKTVANVKTEGEVEEGVDDDDEDDDVGGAEDGDETSKTDPKITEAEATPLQKKLRATLAKARASPAVD